MGTYIVYPVMAIAFTIIKRIDHMLPNKPTQRYTLQSLVIAFLLTSTTISYAGNKFLENNCDLCGKNIVGLKLFYEGNLYAAVNNYVDAIPHYNRAIELDRGNAEFYFYRGFAHSRVHSYRKAIKDYSKAIKLGKNDAEVYNNRGAIYAYLTQYRNAIKDYNLALTFSGDSVETSKTYFNRGNAHRAQKHYKLALNDYETAHRLDPDQQVITNALVWMYATSSDKLIRNSKRSGELAIKILDSGNPAYMDTVAASLASNSDFTTAIILTHDALSIAKNKNSDSDIIRELENHLALYENGQAIFE